LEESAPYLVTTVPAVIPVLAKLPTYVPDAEIPEITPPVIAPPMVRFVVRAGSILKVLLVKF
jgi:hypothetical protein